MPSNEIGWLLRDVSLGDTRLDCRVRAGRVAELRPGLAGVDGERLIDASGGALLPGLADHHIHLLAAAAARDSIDLGGGGLDSVSALDATTDPLRVIGSGVELTREQLDERWPDRAVRVQHRSGALWTLNSAALDALRPGVSADERRTGQFWRASGRLRSLLAMPGRADVSGLARDLAAFGVTHVTDATPDFDPAAVAGVVPQHVLSLGPSGAGPRKIVIPDHDEPDLGALVAAIGRARADGRGVALHVVTAVAMALALAALDEAGTSGLDRVEHAAVCDDAAAGGLAELGVTVVTQPSLLARHGQSYVAESDPHERALLWRYAGLLRAGVKVAASSDAPYGDPNPWRTVQAAVTRRSDDVVIGADERVSPHVALTSFLAAPLDPGGPARTVAVGAAADLCLLADDLDTALENAVRTGTTTVEATFIAGQCVHRRGQALL